MNALVSHLGIIIHTCDFEFRKFSGGVLSCAGISQIWGFSAPWWRFCALGHIRLLLLQTPS